MPTHGPRGGRDGAKSLDSDPGAEGFLRANPNCSHGITGSEPSANDPGGDRNHLMSELTRASSSP